MGGKIISPLMEDAILLGGNIDIIYDTVGNASSIKTSLRLIKYRGNVVLIGAPAYEEIDWTVLMFKEATIIPSMGYGLEIFNGKKIRTFQIAMDLLSSGKVNIEEILTHKFKVEDYEEALTVALDKSINNSVKVAFSFE